jgi:hypothetical protein
MALGKTAPKLTEAMDDPVPAEEGRPIYEAALRARDIGRRIFTCAVTVGFSSGSGMGLGGKKTTKTRRWDTSTLIEAIEDLGWHLEHMDHVWIQTEQGDTLGGATKIKGLTVAHLQFRRVPSVAGSPG